MPQLISATLDRTHTKHESDALETDKHRGGPNQTWANCWAVQSNVSLSLSTPLRSGRLDTFSGIGITVSGAGWGSGTYTVSSTIFCCL